MRAVEWTDDQWGIAWEELIDSFEVDVLHKVDMSDYQGDSWLLLRDGTRYGYLCFGWGSCSGCDAAQACTDAVEATELRDQLWNGILWQDDPVKLLHYLTNKDFSTDWFSTDEEFKAFLDQAIQILGEEAIK